MTQRHVETEKIFVYGTLRKGFSRHRYLSLEAKWIGMGTVKGLLYDLGSYPGVLLSDEGKVKGEVYAINESTSILQKLDRIEGFNALQPERSLFLRTQVEVTMEDRSVEAWIYILPSKPERATLIPTGDYRSFRS